MCFLFVVMIHQNGGEVERMVLTSVGMRRAICPVSGQDLLARNKCKIGRPLPPAHLECGVSSHAGSKGWSVLALTIVAMCCGQAVSLLIRIVIPEVGTIIVILILTTSGCLRIKPDPI